MNSLNYILRGLARGVKKLKSTPRPERNYHRIGLSFSKTGRWSDALESYRSGLASSPDDVEIWRALLSAPKEAGYADAIESLLSNLNSAKAAGSQHRSIIALMQIDRTHQLAGRYVGIQYRDSELRDLEAFLEQLNREGYRDLSFLKSLSDYFWENGPVEHALLPSELYLKESKHLHLLFRASEIYGVSGANQQRRVALLEDAVSFRPTNGTDCLVIALAQARLRRWPDAVKTFEGGLNQWAEDIELWRGYAETAVAAKAVLPHFLEYIERHASNIVDIAASLSPSSAVYFIKQLRNQDKADVCEKITALIVKRLVDGDLQNGVEQAKSYIASASAWNDFRFRDLLCTGIIQHWSSLNSIDHAKAVFKVKLLRLFWAPLVFENDIDDEEFVRNFCSECRKLGGEAMELNDPVADLGPTCIPWQAIYTRAVPHMYSDASTALHDLCARVWPKLTWTASHVSGPRSENRKIKVGFTCLDFMPMISGLMERLDGEKFEKIYLRPPYPGPASETARNWLARADRTVELPVDSVRSVQEAIAAEKLDIIVAGPSLPMSIYPMMARLAPIQITIIEPNWCDNFPNSDYYITWASAEPRDFKRYHRSAVALFQNPPYWLEMQPQTVRPTTVAPSDLLTDAPSHQRVYVCPTQPAKLHPSFDEVLRALLVKDPDGIVVFLRMDNSVGDAIQNRMKKSLGSLSERLVFLPALRPEEAHALLGSVDCVLDAYPLGGMSSSFIAAAIGTPTVSLPAEMPFGKWMGAIYAYVGVEDLTAGSPEQYAEIAYRLASDSEWRESKATEIRSKRSALVEREASAEEFERFLLSAAQRQSDGHQPTDWVNGDWVASSSQKKPDEDINL